MNTRLSLRLRFTIASLAAAVVLLLSNQALIPQTLGGDQSKVSSRVRERAASGERVRVLVQLNLPGHVPEGRLRDNAARLDQRQRVNALQARVLSRLGNAGVRVDGRV